MISGADSILIMLHHNHGIAEIAQMNQGFQQAVIITLMQPDRGLIQHIHHTDQAGTDLAGKTDTLCLAAGQSFCRAGECQVIQADVNQEFQAILNLFQDFFGDFRALAAEFQVIKEIHRMPDAEIRNLRQRGVINKHKAGFFFQTGAATGNTRTVADIFGQFLAHRHGFRFFITALHIVQHTFERMMTDCHITPVIGIFKLNGFTA